MKVEATLVTACGCTRRIDTTFPPPPKIMIALKRIAAFGTASDGAKFPSAYRTRTFTLQDKGRMLTATGCWAEYHEED